jgi:hypothetical protein
LVEAWIRPPSRCTSGGVRRGRHTRLEYQTHQTRGIELLRGLRRQQALDDRAAGDALGVEPTAIIMYGELEATVLTADEFHHQRALLGLAAGQAQLGILDAVFDRVAQQLAERIEQCAEPRLRNALQTQSHQCDFLGVLLRQPGGELLQGGEQLRLRAARARLEFSFGLLVRDQGHVHGGAFRCNRQVTAQIAEHDHGRQQIVAGDLGPQFDLAQRALRALQSRAYRRQMQIEQRLFQRGERPLQLFDFAAKSSPVARRGAQQRLDPLRARAALRHANLERCRLGQQQRAV